MSHLAVVLILLIFCLMQVPVVQAEINGSSSSRRVVLTFSQYDACQQWDSHENDLLCARMGKCYGRRLVLDVHVCYSGNLTDISLAGIFGKGDLLSVEEDGMVVAGSLGEEVDGALVVGEEFNNDDEKVNAAIATGTYGPSTWDVLGANTMFENPLFFEQWNLEMLNISSYNISEVNGKGHVVAVLDSGVAATAAPAFKWLLNGYDFISDTEIALDGDGRDQNSFDPGDRKEGECETSSWHGTYVSSILGARIQKDAFRGIAEESMILPVRVLGKCNMGYASDVADAIAWSIGANITGMEINRLYTAKTILMSFTGKGKCPSYLQTVVSLAVSLNVTLFAAAGNDPSASAQDHFPANCEGVISVGAVDRYGNPTTYTSSNADVYMPGGILSDPVPCLGPNLKVAGCTGTSMAVPHAGGLRALEMTDVDWVDPATLPIPLTPEQLALNYLPHSTYETVVKGANDGSCLSPSVLYADGFCGMRMNTGSDLRTIWQVGYPVVELQPGTYTDSAKHCNLAASVNAAINFGTTYLFSTSAGSVMITCGVPFTVNANFKLYIENITLNTGSGGNEIYCSGTSALLGLTNVRIQGYEGRAHFTNNALTIQNGCGLVTRGSLTFGLKSTSLGQTANSLLRFINPSTETSDIGGDMILFDQATSTWGILVTFTTKQANAWVWNVSDIFVNGGGGAQPWQASSNLRHLFERCNIIIKKYRTTGPGPIHMADATLLITEEFHRQDSTNSLWSWGDVGIGSLLTFNSSISRMVVQGAFNRLTINGGKVYIQCNNTIVRGGTQISFLIQNRGYLEWSGSHGLLSGNSWTGSGGVFLVETSGILNVTGSNITFQGNTATGANGGGGAISAMSSASVYLSGSQVSFRSNYATGTNGGGGAISAMSSASVYLSGSDISFISNYAIGAGGGGGAVSLNTALIGITGVNVSFQENLASSLLVWYPFDGSLESMLHSGINRSSCKLVNNGALFDAINKKMGTGSAAFDSGKFVSIPFSLDPRPFAILNGITVSMWFSMSTSTTAWSQLFQFNGQAGSSANNYFGAYRESSTSSLTLWTNGQSYQLASAVNNAFHHLVWTISSAGVWNIYLDNVLACNGCRTSQIPNCVWHFQIIGNFVGNVDDFMVFARVLSSAEVLLLYSAPLSSSPVLWYPFDASSQLMLLDRMNNTAYNLQNSGATVDLSMFRRGTGSVALTGNTYVSIPLAFNPYPIAAATGITVSMWFSMSTSTPEWSTLFQFNGQAGSSTDNYFGAYRAASTSSLTLWTNGQSYQLASAVNNAFHHLVWTISSAGVWNIYLDNVLACNGCRTSQIPNCVWHFQIIGNFVGNVDDFRVIPMVLSASEISILYNSAANVVLTDTSIFIGPESHGGAISLKSGVLVVNSSKTIFMQSFAGGSGGAVSGDRFSSITLNSPTFTQNTAALRGGGLHIELPYRPLTMNNVLAVQNLALSGDGGFLHVNGSCHLYANNTWENLQCHGNTAQRGRGGCIFLSNDETASLIPFDVNIVDPVFGSTNWAALGSSNMIYAADPWVTISSSAGIQLMSPSDMFITGFDNQQSYPYTFQNFYSGDPNPSFSGRCPAGQAMHPVTNNVCVTPISHMENVISLVRDFKQQDLVLWPGTYTDVVGRERYCGFSTHGAAPSFSVSAGYSYFLYAGLLKNYNETKIDCGINFLATGYNIPASFYANINFQMAFVNVWIHQVRNIGCEGCMLNLSNVNIRQTANCECVGGCPVRGGHTSFGFWKTGSTSCVLNIGGDVILHAIISRWGPSYGTRQQAFAFEVDVSKSRIGGNMFMLSGGGPLAGFMSQTSYFLCSSMQEWVWTVDSLDVANAEYLHSAQAYNRYGGPNFIGCNITLKGFRSYNMPRLSHLVLSSFSVMRISQHLNIERMTNPDAGVHSIIVDAGSSLEIGPFCAVFMVTQQPMFFVEGNLTILSNSTTCSGTRSYVFRVRPGGYLNLEASNMTFSNNGAVNGSVFNIEGGAVDVRLQTSRFSDNFATNSGGILYSDSSKQFAPLVLLSFSYCNFTANTAAAQGAVVFTGKFSPSITFNNCTFIDNCASFSTSRHAISMGYFPDQNVGSISKINILGTATSFSRSIGKTSSNCPYIRASSEAYIQDLTLDASDIAIPNSICQSGQQQCRFQDFYSGPYSEVPFVVNNSVNLGSRITNPFDVMGRKQDSAIYVLQPGVYSNGACNLIFTVSPGFSNVTIMGSTNNPNDTIINCSASTFFATVGAGFTLNLDNLYIIRGTATNTPAISVAGTLFMENVTVGGVGGLMSVSAYANGGILNPTVITGTSFSQYSFVTTGVINSITFTEDTLVDILIIGGGGSGASRYGGGGGAGSLIYLQNYTMAAGTYSVNVGAGGASVTALTGTSGLNGNSGGDSYIARNGVDILRAKGGGGGASCVNLACSAGFQGGSSGGSSANTNSLSAEPTIFNVPGGLYGNYGGGGTNVAAFVATSRFAGGGGGGSGSAGGNAASLQNAVGGSGGNAITLSIIGSERAYAGGGGGGCSSDATGAGAGGSSTVNSVSTVVGGAGSKGAVAATAGSANTGSGGGGSGNTGTTNAASGAGGSGIVIVRFSFIQIQKNVFSIPTVISGTAFSHHSFNIPSFRFEVTFLTDMVVDVLVVGGGGSGGSRHAGGGGAGALLYFQNYTFKAGLYIVYVGNGGSSVKAANGYSGIDGLNGEDSYISLNSIDVLRAKGGGGGAHGGKGFSGGSSGGGSIFSGSMGISYPPLQTNIPGGVYGSYGGSGSNLAVCSYSSPACAGGGGGGAGGDGANALFAGTGAASGGNGGSAVTVNIAGVQMAYAAGGGGGCDPSGPSAGSGGSSLVNSVPSVVGGAGSKGGVAASAGAANTGSGGGGAGFSTTTNGASGAGGSGTVIIRFASSLSSSIRVSSTRQLTTTCGNTGLVCAGTTASCTLSGTNTFESISACMAANGGAIRAHTSASLLVQGNLTLRNIASAYAIRMEIGAGNVVFNLQNFVAQETYGGLLNILNGAGGSGMVNFSVADSTLVQGNLGNAHLFISDGIVSTQGVSISFGGRRAVISDNQITGHIFFVGHPAAHALGLPQISLTSSQQVDISHNLIGDQLARLNTFAYMLVECPEANITISNNTLTTVNRHLIEVTATSSRVEWMCRNLTMSSNLLTNGFQHISIAMGNTMLSSFNVTGWLWVEPRMLIGVYPHFLVVSGTGTSSTFSAAINNAYFSGLQGSIHITPNSATASCQVLIQGLLTITRTYSNWALMALQSAASGPRAVVRILGGYAFVENNFGMVRSAGVSDIIFESTSSGVVANNTVTVTAANYFEASAATATLQVNGLDLVVQNNTHHAVTATNMFSFVVGLNAPANASSFSFSGLVYAETSFVPATVTFLSVTGSSGTFILRGNHFVASGYHRGVISVSLTSTARLSRATFSGYFEISNRPLGTGPAIHISQAGLTPGTGGISMELLGFYNFTGNVAASNPIANLASNAVVVMSGMGGVLDSNLATGAGTQVLFNVASGTNSMLIFAGNMGIFTLFQANTGIIPQLPLLISGLYYLAFRPSLHVIRSNAATFVTTCVAGTVLFNTSSICSTGTQGTAISCTFSSPGTCDQQQKPCPVASDPFCLERIPSTSSIPANSSATPAAICQSLCIPCPAGTYSNQEECTSCLACTEGLYSGSQGSTTCLSCPAGKATSLGI